MGGAGAIGDRMGLQPRSRAGDRGCGAETFHLAPSSAAVAPFLYSSATWAHEASERRNQVAGASGCDLLMALEYARPGHRGRSGA